MKSKSMKVAYTSRYQKNGTRTVPQIRMEGKWLEELGFSAGSSVMVEYEEGSIRIRPLNETELALEKQKELRLECKRRSLELKVAERNFKAACQNLSKVAEASQIYANAQ